MKLLGSCLADSYELVWYIYAMAPINSAICRHFSSRYNNVCL